MACLVGRACAWDTLGADVVICPCVETTTGAVLELDTAGVTRGPASFSRLIKSVLEPNTGSPRSFRALLISTTLMSSILTAFSESVPLLFLEPFTPSLTFSGMDGNIQ